MFEKLKRFGTHGCCFAGVLAVGAIAAGTRTLPPAAGAQGGAVLVADAQEGQVPAVQQHVDSVARSYLLVQGLLAGDKLEGVGAEFKKIRDAAAALSESGEGEVAAQAKTVTKHADVRPKDLKEARTAFKPLSAAVIGLVKVVPPSANVAPELYEATCGMAKANWLQSSKELANPYMGQKMLKCGSIERKIGPATGGKDKKEPAARAGGGNCCSTAPVAAAPGPDGSSCH